MIYFRLSNYGVPWFSRTNLNHHCILLVCEIPSFWLCSIFLAAAVSFTCSGDAGAALEEDPDNPRISLLEMSRRLGRIQNSLGCHQSYVDFMALTLFQVGDPAQSHQTELEQL